MTRIFAPSAAKIEAILMGRLLVGADMLARHRWLRRLERLVNDLGRLLFRRVRVAPPEEGGSASPDAGRLAPLRPSPGHHLVAAKALPPGDDVYLLPKD